MVTSDQSLFDPFISLLLLIHYQNKVCYVFEQFGRARGGFERSIVKSGAMALPLKK